MQHSEDKHNTFGLLLGLVAVISFGITLPATRIAIIELDPYFIFIGRVILAAFVATLILVLTRQPIPPRSTLFKLMITSLGVVIGFPLFATLAMQYAPASRGGIVLAILPLATAVASVIFAQERPSLGFWICSILGAIAVLIFTFIEGAAQQDLQYGDILLGVAVVSAAVGYAQGGSLARDFGGWQVICWALVISLPVMFPLGVFFLGDINWTASYASWTSFFYLALISQLFGFFLWNKGLALGGVAKVGQTQLLQPFVTLVASAWLIGEIITNMQILFACLVFVIVAASRQMRVTHRTKNCK